MPLELMPATEADALRAAGIESIAFGPSPFNKVLFPGPFPDSPLADRAESMAKALREDSTQRWLKVVDTDLEGDEQMIAFAKWHVFTEKPVLPPRQFGPGCNIEACEKLFGGMREQRIRLIGDRPYVCEYICLLSSPSPGAAGAGHVKETRRQRTDTRDLRPKSSTMRSKTSTSWCRINAHQMGS
jgi:hypothetical protein